MLEWICTIGGFLIGVAGFVALGLWLFARLRPEVDPLHGDPRARKLKRKLQYFDDWQYAHAFLSGIDDRDERGWYLGAVADVLKDWDDRGFMDIWVKNRAESPIPWLFRGISKTFWAWEARGSGYASSVSEEGWRLFRERLDSAEEDLEQAAELDPQDATPIACLLTVAMGRSKGLEAAQHLFARAIERDPFHVGAHNSMLYLLTKKWGGSHEAMFAFARERTDAAPKGHPLHALIAFAHIERWLYFSFEDDLAGERAYFDRDDVREELDTAFLQLEIKGAAAERKMISALNEFAFCFWKLKERGRARQCFRRLTLSQVTESPWSYIDDPITVFKRAREQMTG